MIQAMVEGETDPDYGVKSRLPTGLGPPNFRCSRMTSRGSQNAPF